MSKVTKDQYIKDLEYDVGTLTDMVLNLRIEKNKIKQEILDRVQDILWQNNSLTALTYLDLLRHDLENEIIEEKNETN